MDASSSKVKTEITVVIVSYNTCELTLKCIESIIEYQQSLNVDIIVVDNNSTDDSVEKIKQTFPNITLIASDENLGFANANNLGFEQCDSDYVLVLNPDTEIKENTLQNSLAYLKAHPEIGALGCKVLFESGEQQSTLFRFLTLRELFFSIFLPYSIRRLSPIFGDERYYSLDHDQDQEVEVVTGCFMLLPKAVVDKTNGFNSKFFMYAEETEWCYRIKQLGYKVAYTPSAEIMHHGAASSSHLTAWKKIEMARGKLLFLSETRGKFVSAIANILMLLGTLPKLVLSLAKKRPLQEHLLPNVKQLLFHIRRLFWFK